jgi:hypothetical protein
MGTEKASPTGYKRTNTVTILHCIPFLSFYGATPSPTRRDSFYDRQALTGCLLNDRALAIIMSQEVGEIISIPHGCHPQLSDLAA